MDLKELRKPLILFIIGAMAIALAFVPGRGADSGWMVLAFLLYLVLGE